MEKIEVIEQGNKLKRLLIPSELKKQLGLEEDIFVKGGKIILKTEAYCDFCKNKNDLVKFKDKFICQSCRQDISKIEK